MGVVKGKGGGGDGFPRARKLTVGVRERGRPRIERGSMESRVDGFQVWQSSKNGQWYWRLRAKNYEPVAIGGEGFSSEDSCRASIDIVKTCGDAAVKVIEDPNA